ncbi:S8 family serine peptidase [Sphingomonadaceae bacterium LXI357]|uniref:S8 family serine peptidase n=2 Tax=Stakelama marina TaxID=2826939 RepID=A0A8T4IDU1_9SPHN|nr:S8 family serine peptidase [Stakelama marina]
MNALAAYQKGATGTGVTVGVVDTGLDAASEEFENRVVGSRNTAGGSSTDDVDGHGTAVAFVVAGRNNGVGTHGAAFDANLYIARADTPGSCASANPDQPDSGCSFDDSAIAAGIDAAISGGARVINLSLGGSRPSNQLLQSISRATASGAVIVISAGNDGEDPSKGDVPDPFTSPATNNSVSRGQIIIAGSVDASDRISSFSNRAGTGAAASFYLAAVGEDVRAPCDDTKVCLWSGTSFSAPQISGAVALLAQAFPNLTGKQMVDLLLATARDAGASGTDAVYGRGILDLTEAFAPQGSMSVAGTQQTVSTGVEASLSAPMGDAATGTVGAVVLDGFDRAYAVELARTIDRAGPGRTLVGALRFDRRNLAATNGRTAVAVTLLEGRNETRVERLAMPFSDAQAARAMAAAVTTKLDDRLSFGIAASEGGDSLVARLSGRTDPAFLVAGDPTRRSGFDVDIAGSAAVRNRFGPWGISVAAESGDVLTRGDRIFGALRNRYQRFGYDRFAIGVDRRFGPVSAALTLTQLEERNTLLGARFGGALGGAGASTRFVDLNARADLGGGWSLGASTRQGWTTAHLHGGIAGSGSLRTSGYAVDIGRDGAFDRRDHIGLRIAQPLRVEHGGLDLMLPSYWDYASQSVASFSDQRLNLAPQGREVDAEIAYTRPLLGGDVATNPFYRRNPGNFSALPDDYGAALRFTYGW